MTHPNKFKTDAELAFDFIVSEFARQEFEPRAILGRMSRN
jgi:hypothetical protein